MSSTTWIKRTGPSSSQPPGKDYKGIWIELERCEGCEKHRYCTRHEEHRYDNYEKTCISALKDIQDENSIPFVMNPGPAAHGMKCRPVKHNQTVLYQSMHQDIVTRKWAPTGVFRYPRLGAFEVYVCRGSKRIEVFSKLKTMRWPNAQWLAKRVEETVIDVFGGWSTLEQVVKPQRTAYSGVGGKQTISDDQLRKHIKAKFHTLNAAFRSLDKNGDGVIDKGEFTRGMQKASVDLPPQVLEEMWKIADADGGGSINYLEFCRKFSSFQASHSLHRHASIRQGEEIVDALHGMGKSSRIATSAKIRRKEETTYAVDERLFDPNAEVREKTRTISQLARELGDTPIAPEDLTVDILRARMVNLHGSLLNAFRHFDVDGSSSVSYEEWNRYLPKVFGDDFPQRIADRLWKDLDTEQKGEIDLTDFFEDRLFDQNHVPLRVLRGMAEDPTVQRSRPRAATEALGSSGSAPGRSRAATEASPRPTASAPTPTAAPSAPAAPALPTSPSAPSAPAAKAAAAVPPNVVVVQEEHPATADSQARTKEDMSTVGLPSSVQGVPGVDDDIKEDHEESVDPALDENPEYLTVPADSNSSEAKQKRPTSGASLTTTASTADFSSSNMSVMSSRPPSALSNRPQSAGPTRNSRQLATSEAPPPSDTAPSGESSQGLKKEALKLWNSNLSEDAVPSSEGAGLKKEALKLWAASPGEEIGTSSDSADQGNPPEASGEYSEFESSGNF